MTTGTRCRQAAVVWMAALLTQDAMAMTNFASDEVRIAAKTGVAAEALAARGKLDQAFAAQDLDSVSALCAKDLIVNTPANRVARLDQVLGLFRRAERMATAACNANFAPACSLVAFVLLQYDGARRDPIAAAEWRRKACDGNYWRACFDLGLQYRAGEGVAQDSERAVTLFRRACDHGNDLACEYVMADVHAGPAQ